MSIPAHKVVGDVGKPGQLSFDRYPYLKHSTAEPQINTPKKLTFEEWLKTTNITTDDTLLYNWGITVWQAAMAAVPAQPVLDCEIQPRPLPYPLTDYHRAGIDGPLHYTWKDKPHRLLYDLIAAVRYYAAPKAVPVPADMALTIPPSWRR